MNISREERLNRVYSNISMFYPHWVTYVERPPGLFGMRRVDLKALVADGRVENHPQFRWLYRAKMDITDHILAKKRAAFYEAQS